MLIHGTADPWSSYNADMVFDALQYLDKTIELRAYPGQEHHTLRWTKDSRRDVHERAVEWFREHLLKQGL